MQFHKKLAFGLPAHFASRSSKLGVYAISAASAGLKADVRKLAVEVGQVNNPALTAKVPCPSKRTLVQTTSGRSTCSSIKNWLLTCRRISLHVPRSRGFTPFSASAAGLKADVRKLAVEVGQVNNPALTAKVQATAGSDRGPGQWPYRICSPSTATIIRTPI